MLPFTDDLQGKQSTSQPSVKSARVIRRVQWKKQLTCEYTEMHRAQKAGYTGKAGTVIFINGQTPETYLLIDLKNALKHCLNIKTIKTRFIQILQ